MKWLQCVLMLACIVGAPAWAHSPVLACRSTSVDVVVCRGGFSDGSAAPGGRIEVVDKDGKLLLVGKLDKASTMTFTRPAGAFYVLFDAEPGHVVEVSHAEIRAPLRAR